MKNYNILGTSYLHIALIVNVLKMKNKNKFIVNIIFSIFLFWSCSTNKENIIELDANIKEKLTLDYTSKIIQLETNTESLMGYIFKVNIDVLNNRIFVLTEDFNIYIFDIDGRYHSKLKVGKGPDEITNVVCFTINTSTRSIYAIDNSRRLCLFDYDGNLVKTYNIENFASTDISILDDENIFLLRNFVGAEENYFVGVYNIKEEKIVKKFISEKKSLYPRYSLGTTKNFSRHGNDIYLSIPNIFGLFEYTDSNFDQILSFDIGKKKLSKSLLKELKERRWNYCELRERAKSMNLAPYVLFGFKFKEYYFIGIDDDEFNCYAISETNKKVFHNGTLLSYFNLPEKESFHLAGVQNDLITLCCNPVDFFDSKTQEDVKEIQILKHRIEIDRNNNPFLIVVE